MFFNVVFISWTKKCWVSLMQGVTIKFALNILHKTISKDPTIRNILDRLLRQFVTSF